MSMYLCKRTDVFRGDSEAEVEEFLNKLKLDNSFEIKKYSIENKETKDDNWVHFEVTKLYNDEKMPDTAYIMSDDEE